MWVGRGKCESRKWVEDGFTFVPCNAVFSLLRNQRFAVRVQRDLSQCSKFGPNVASASSNTRDVLEMPDVRVFR